MAKRLRVGESAIYAWRSGQNRPGPELRALLEQIYRLPATAWDEPARRQG